MKEGREVADSGVPGVGRRDRCTGTPVLTASARLAEHGVTVTLVLSAFSSRSVFTRPFHFIDLHM